MNSLEHWEHILTQGQYLATEDIVEMVRLAQAMGRPLLLEGPSGSGKTALAQALAIGMQWPLIRLSCYEGLGASEALYDWNYHAQWVAMTTGQVDEAFSDQYLLPRPLMKAIVEPSSVLLIDEVDRADEAFEALLLEYLSDYQISIPERGTIRASHAPLTVLTSNRQRPLSDALRRRCLYLYIDWPDEEREHDIVHFHVPELANDLCDAVVRAVHQLRQWDLIKPPGLSETIDWARAAVVDGISQWDVPWMQRTLGLVIKDALDLKVVRERIEELAST